MYSFALLFNHRVKYTKPNPGLNLVQSGLQPSPIARIDGDIFPSITCDECKKKVYHANECPSTTSTFISMCQIYTS